MSFEDCIAEVRQDDTVSKDMVDDAERVWNEKRAEYRSRGEDELTADRLAEQDVMDFLKAEAASQRHRKMMTLANNQKILDATADASDENLQGFATHSLKYLDLKARRLEKYFRNEIGRYLDANYRNVFSQQVGADVQPKIIAEMMGEATDDEAAKAMASTLKSAFERMRVMANRAGAVIPKLDDWAVPHMHNRWQVMYAGIERIAKERGVSPRQVEAQMAISRNMRQQVFSRSFDQWFDDVAPRLDWTRIIDHETWLPFQRGEFQPDVEAQRRFLKSIFDEIVYGPNSAKAEYSGGRGTALWRRHGQRRVLHFKDSENWLTYNKKYGSGDIHQTLISHVQTMARDIVHMQEFGPNPTIGADFQGQAIIAEARKRGLNVDELTPNLQHAEKMFRIERGGRLPNGYWKTLSANFFSTARRVTYGNMLELASVASLSDNAFIRGMARSIGADPNKALAQNVMNMVELAKSRSPTSPTMRHWRWITDTHNDPGASAARFEAEIGASEWAEKFSTSVMRLSGLTGMTDSGKFTAQVTWAAQLSTQMGRRFEDIDPQILTRLQEAGVTASDWAHFSRADTAFTPEPGVHFLHDIYWREATDLPAEQADEIALKFGAAAEMAIEEAVPTQNLYMRAIIDPVGVDLEPGSLTYELLKSAGMFKSFPLSVTGNQYGVLSRLPSGASRWNHGLKVFLEATITGAISLQLGEVSRGNDPRPMDDPRFWSAAVLKGGGLAIIGDLIVAGETTWQGGLASYFAGPMVQLAQDTTNLTLSNMVEVGRAVMAGEEIDTNLVPELRDYIGRYLIPKDMMYFGPAIDRMLLDQAQIMLDPESADAILAKATKKENLYGNGAWWMPGSPSPDRAPSFDLTGQ